jgi:hypothetical protein
MAEAHVYVRVQVSGSNADVTAIEKAGKALREAVTAAGGEWRGDVQVQLDDESHRPAIQDVNFLPSEPVKARRFGK